MKNQVQLITYADRLTANGLDSLKKLLRGPLNGLFSGVHILPFFYPIDGSDAGFDPIDHAQIDPRLGSWENLKQLGHDTEIMADLIVNHASAKSPEFLDVLRKGQESEFWTMFLKEKDIFPDGITEEEAKQIYRPRPGSCFSPKQLQSGESVNFWTTFTDNQIDINVECPVGQAYLEKVLKLFAANGVKIIRLDAAGYAIKRAGTSCFMTDEAFAFVDELSKKANELGMETVAEIHSYYKTQVDVAKRVNRVYDFALPPLILHTLFTRNVDTLTSWLNIAPRNCLTVLDTHDGIGIIDAGPQGEKPGLLTADEIHQLVEKIHENSQGQSRKATGSAASNVDLYQVNCTYYDALAGNDLQYLFARAIQFFSPGVPQVYYGGLLAIHNDMDLLERTNVGRDINRPYLNEAIVESQLQQPVVQGLCKLIKIRNCSSAFDGTFSVQGEGGKLSLYWENGTDEAILLIDFARDQGMITIKQDNCVTHYDIETLIS
ncbi:sucrose phosphorylase [Vibrio parahaemolyticus]|uniref:sucrose phosphorylase n=1 Tax=Vibrio TaxID=662 RepID=UPI000A0F83C8|nr:MULTISPECIES: sucrose phosphorylase [Vibrio]EJB8417604.1 sucrose phosphorylase [Vibrio vulnificus]EGQ7972250.1 sucrose phosphorylase [Vibrio parahaemolyticus]EGQ7976371.1 sucrose phosphorylase [Vibrio parahaemolyticus]EGR1579619.1 sucrose phosphorylase [Vibrio parahaemolyticus]EGR1579941.1 sucrose phosphorylase [Vibrio parahaemolyticus]